ncbi:hypothetical protein GCM10007304_31140 [Rhodococcoides trifolii]|uniref:Serine hydrolase n=1 Tax=Rhodococcoides trifolii TaxID=908250 RepID=A0A917FZ42_9NOCA|nr:hypothetical protein [Rhodococcus trifolii]GGG14865.1 hypothetical protein GCM10007304_31140 [Rhodococcus trifolii]
MRRTFSGTRRLAAVAALVALLPLGAVATASAQPASARPLPADFAGVPSRTALVLDCAGTRIATPNAAESRPGLSEVKLFIVDYAIRRGDGSAGDRDLAADMITSSDDYAASQLDRKYPSAIDSIADEYGLTSTSRGSFWGDSYTSAADLVTFLEGVKRLHPDSPIPGWMAAATPVASDGTDQNWGTSQLIGVQGTKWGWADDISTAVASASIGPGFSVAAITLGGPSDQNEDVQAALGGVDLARSQPTAPALPEWKPGETLEQIVRSILGS